MRLIDADEVILHLNDFMLQQSPIDVQDIESIKVSAVIQDCIKAIENQQTAYDVDKVVEELENEREYAHADFEQYAELHGIDTEDDWFYAGMRRAIEIVKAGGTND